MKELIRDSFETIISAIIFGFSIGISIGIVIGIPMTTCKVIAKLMI